MTRKSTQLRGRKLGAQRGSVVTRASDFGRLSRVDGPCEEVANVDRFIKAICRRREIPPDLAKRLRKRRRLGPQALCRISKAAERAIFDIETPKSFILNEIVERRNAGTYALGMRTTALPSTRRGGQLLCMEVRRSTAGLTCKLAVVILSVKGDKRTVVVGSHLCDRIAERAKILGSHVAFVAKSAIRRQAVVYPEGKRQPHLTIFGWNDEILGYCPISEVSCELQPNSQVKLRNYKLKGKTILEDQPRWLLKTFLLPGMVKVASLKSGPTSHRKSRISEKDS